MTRPTEITSLLEAWADGDASALDALLPLVYAELRRIATGYLSSERGDHTLQPTALVHEAYLRLTGQQIRWENRKHFYAIAAQAMRRILVDHARRKLSLKRGGDRAQVDLAVRGGIRTDRPQNLVALDDALAALARLDENKARIVELRFFGGCSAEEIADLLGSSRATVNRQWKLAKAWLYRELAVPPS